MDNSNKDKSKLAVAYMRSALKNQDPYVSIARQDFGIDRYALSRGYTIVKKYTDEGFSGLAYYRPALMQLFIDAEQNNWKTLIIFDYSRLARNRTLLNSIEIELSNRGIKIESMVAKPLTGHLYSKLN